MRGLCDHGIAPFRNRFIDVAFDVHAVMKVERGRIRSLVEEHGGELWYQRFVKEPCRTIVRERAAPIRVGPVLDGHGKRG